MEQISTRRKQDEFPEAGDVMGREVQGADSRKTAAFKRPAGNCTDKHRKGLAWSQG